MAACYRRLAGIVFRLMNSSQRDPSVTVVIPVYQSRLSEGEKISLQQCMAVLQDYSVKIFKPRSLNLEHLKEQYPAIDLISFDDVHFTGIDA